MKVAKAVCIGLLVVYTLSLLYAELKYSQGFVRNFFSDEFGPVFLFGINTTLSASLLWATALLFGISGMLLEGKPAQRREKAFYVSQILMFSYLGLDDRFRLHEYVDQYVPHGETLVLVGAAALEACLLIALGDLKSRPQRTRVYLGIGAVLSAVMLFVDTFLPYDLLLRLSCEDLSKVWAEVFLFLFAFEILRVRIEDLKNRASPRTIEVR